MIARVPVCLACWIWREYAAGGDRLEGMAMAWNPQFAMQVSDDGTTLGLVLEKPYYPVGLSTDERKLIFADITGDKSDPIPIPDGVERVVVQMLWSSAGWFFKTPVPSNGWVDMDGDSWDPIPPQGIKRVLFHSTPHSYAGGDSTPWKVRLSTVIRDGDLPFRRDEHGAWTASGLFLELSNKIPARSSFEACDLESTGDGRIILVPRVE